MLREKITLKLVLGVVQALMSFSAVALAIALRFDLFNAQEAFSIVAETANFYITLLLVAGIIFLIAGLFLIYDWWESQK